jgi:hypothetical protein
VEKFQAKGITPKGNEYEKTNAGLYTGLTLGGLGGAYISGVGAFYSNFMKKEPEIKDAAFEFLAKFQTILNKKFPHSMQNIDQAGEIKKMQGALESQFRTSRFVRIGVCMLLISAGVGKLYDHFANEKTAAQADK